MRSHTRLTLVLAGSMVMALAPTSSAQDALGSGDALDANLSVTEGRRNSAVGARGNDRYSARNLLITGNVPGGRGFRGTVGYSAATDFRATAGSDDLYSFRADSAFSSIGYATSRAGQSLRFGQDLGLLEYRRSSTPPSIVPGAPASVQSTRQLVDIEFRLDQSLRATSTESTVRREADGNLLGAYDTAEGQTMVVAASPVRGIYQVSTGNFVQSIGLTEYDRTRLQEDIQEGRESARPGTPFDTRFSSTLLDSKVPTERVFTPKSEEYASIMERIANRYAEREDTQLQLEPSLLQQLDEQYKALRDQLSDRQDAQGRASNDASDESNEESDDNAEGSSRPLPPVSEDTQPAHRLGDRDMRTLLQHGHVIERLAKDDGTRFSELMIEGSTMLSQEQYFRAERRFERALQFTPNQPMAMAGMSHAQFGAGLHLPASITLRRLLTRHPLMIDVIYDSSLLPSAEIAGEGFETLRRRIADQPNMAGGLGLVLAYFGRQFSDRQAIEDGLRAMQQVDPEDPLLDVLREIWLGMDAGETVESMPEVADDPGLAAPDVPEK
jgi:hypothetical protein